ncbi:hypothetical protein [Gemmata sp.]|uniref:hypothetical protein n=1 Tax=Gemmata sp. TaxID=1914242 RepID=UPI003F70A623
MMRTWRRGLVLVLAISVAGCSGNSEADAYYKDYIATQNALAEALEKKEPLDSVKAAAERMVQVRDKGKSIKWRSSEEEAEYQKKYAQQLLNVHMRTTGAANSHPDGAAVVSEVIQGDVMKDLEKMQKDAMKDKGQDPAKKIK